MSQLIVSDVQEDDALESHPSVAHLPAYPSSREDYLAWGEWALVQYQAKRMPVLRADFAQSGLSAKARLTVAWRAILGYWAEQRSVAPDDAPLIAHHFLLHAQDAPPFVMLAASRLTRACLHNGATSTDVLFLAATWAWPLRDVDAELSDICWDYLVHAPWQTDPLSYKDLLLAVEIHQGFRDGRDLLALVDARHEAGARTSARHLLEAVVLVQSRKERLDQLASYRDFSAAPLLEGGNDAIVRLADLYQQERNDQVHAREVMKRAAELTRSRVIVDYIEDQIWDRPIDEAYRWCESLTHPRQLDVEIDRAISNAQPHHARRLAEAVMVRKFNRLWYGSLASSSRKVLRKIRSRVAPPSTSRSCMRELITSRSTRATSCTGWPTRSHTRGRARCFTMSEKSSSSSTTPPTPTTCSDTRRRSWPTRGTCSAMMSAPLRTKSISGFRVASAASSKASSTASPG